MWLPRPRSIYGCACKGSPQVHLRQALLLPLLVADGELGGRLRLLDDHHPQARPRQPLGVRVVIRLWEPRMRLLPLRRRQTSTLAGRAPERLPRLMGSPHAGLLLPDSLQALEVGDMHGSHEISA